MAITDDISRFVEENFPVSQQSPFSIFSDYLYIAVILVVFGVIGFIIYRAIQKETEYAGDGEAYGTFTFYTQGESRITGNLSKNETFHNTPTFEVLKKESKIQQGSEEVMALIESKKLFFYDFKIIDYDKSLLLKRGRNAVIITSVPIQKDEFSWQDKKGEWSITGVNFKKYPKRVLAFIDSEHKTPEDPFGNEIDVWILAVIPKEIEMPVEKPFSEKEIHLIISKPPSSENLALMATHIPTLVQIYKKINVDQDRIKKLEEMLHDASKSNSALNMERNQLRNMLKTKTIYGHARPLTPTEKIIEWGWIVGAVFAGAFGYGVIPEIELLQGFPPWMGVMIALILVVAFRHIAEKRKPIQTELTTKESESQI